ncbi:MAG: alpha/beta hydrolase-fold protein [Negativicutes bacterium]|nr:alpha/beta hydrolase-fold protein [Negativicutes bacterium]
MRRKWQLASDCQLTAGTGADRPAGGQHPGKKVKVSQNLDGTLIVSGLVMPELGRRRSIRIYLPSDYYRLPQKRYPVLYMHDGQNVFSDAAADLGSGWHVNETIERLMALGKTRGCIVVGIENGRELRDSEYNPTEEGDAYGEFIVNTLKPLVDCKLRTIPYRRATAIAGSSAGGVIALYVGLKYQDVFSMIGAFSPAIWWSPAGMDGFVRQRSMRIYMDIGTGECEGEEDVTADYEWSTRWFYDGLRRGGFHEDDIMLFQVDGGQHSESDWASRFPLAYMWLMENYLDRYEMERGGVLISSYGRRRIEEVL